METRKAIVDDVEPEKFIALETKLVLTPDVEVISTAGVVMERRPSGFEVVRGSRGLARAIEGGSSSMAGGSRVVPVGDDDSGSDIDPEEIRAFMERTTRVGIRAEVPNQHIVIPVNYDLLANSELAVSAFSPLCAASKNTTLQTMTDVDLSLGISDMALLCG